MWALPSDSGEPGLGLSLPVQPEVEGTRREWFPSAALLGVGGAMCLLGSADRDASLLHCLPASGMLCGSRPRELSGLAGRNAGRWGPGGSVVVGRGLRVAFR